ncbi:replication protein, partial [Klebsiella grimontii]|nr:replication protein [Klebsiella grimontii]
YFINPDYMFNGDRLTFMKTYYLKDNKTKKNK